MPHKDAERGSYGIQIPTLGRLFVKALAVHAKSETALKLTNLKGVTADYGDIVYDVMKNRSPETGKLTVYEVNKYLDLIAEHFEQNERNREYNNRCHLSPCLCLSLLTFANATVQYNALKQNVHLFNQQRLTMKS